MRMLLGIQGLAFLNSITGGSMQQMSFFALSISPYITASIIMQLMTVVFPSLGELQKDGKTGRERFKRITQAAAVALSIIQSVAMAAGLGAPGILYSGNSSRGIRDLERRGHRTDRDQFFSGLAGGGERGFHPAVRQYPVLVPF